MAGLWPGILAATALGSSACSDSRPEVFTSGNNDPFVDGGGPASNDAGGHDHANGTGGAPTIPPPLPSIPPIHVTPDAGSGGSEDFPACAEESFEAERVGLDMFVMLDQSSSMSFTAGETTRWALVSAALERFIAESPDSDGVGIGLQYFGLHEAPVLTHGNACWSDPDCGPGAHCLRFQTHRACAPIDSCNPADYAVPEVPIQAWNDAAPQILASLAAHQPSTATPTRPALQGAIQYAKTWAEQHRGRQVIVLFATDGEPSDCGEDIEEIARIAADGADTSPSVKTYIVGVGVARENLTLIAMAGRGQVFFVDADQNIAESMHAALNRVRTAALPCDYHIPEPESGTIDYDRVNVYEVPAAFEPEIIENVGDEQGCHRVTGGWYYDDPESPSLIRMCKATCDRVAIQPDTRIDIRVGCVTKRAVPR